MLQLIKQIAVQNLYITRTKATPTGVTRWVLKLKCRATNNTIEGSLSLILENERLWNFEIYVNTNELNNINLEGPDGVGGFYDYDLEAVSDGGSEVLSSGLLYYDLGLNSDSFDTFGTDITFKGYE